MTNQDQPNRPRRPASAKLFGHVEKVAGTIDFSGMSSPGEMLAKAQRAVIECYRELNADVSLDGMRFIPASADGVAAEWAVAEGASSKRRLVYIHGGGWAAGSPAIYRPLSATLARLTGAAILMVDYRLAPEHRFPAGLDDCVKAYAWARLNGPDGQESAERISIAGDSAGGNLSAATCLRIALAGWTMPHRLVLIAGTLDNVAVTERVGIDDPLCTRESLAGSTANYLAPGHDATDPLVSPVFASNELLAHFPPTLLQVSSSEALLHDSKAFAARLEAAGVRFNLSVWPDLPHVWHGTPALFEEGDEALREIAAFIT